MLAINEIFSSLQGEGKYTGYPTTFIRLFKCNLYCTFCDTPYATGEGRKKRVGIEQILKSVNLLGNKHVCVTGGEPLLQEEVYPLIYELVEKGYIVAVETNGSIAIEKDNYNRSFSYCMDVKCPSSGMAGHNIYSNLQNLLPKDEVKFVIACYNDYMFAKGVIRQYGTPAQIIMSPCAFADDGDSADIRESLATWIEQDKLPNVRLGMQMHKILNIQ